MRIATLQFDPALGEVEGNIKKADSILDAQKDRLGKLDLLVLPELAFTGRYSRTFLS
jgi:predicted amidohydrolase